MSGTIELAVFWGHQTMQIYVWVDVILLMAEILHHLGCMKPYK